ncbi:MAG TPA: hypothetical protein PK829_04925 [Promineifilum sp.]|nr:hypothetical protein [Promineifilum sp.]
MKRLNTVLIAVLLVLALAACEDTTVHTTPPAPVSGDSSGGPTVTIDPSSVGPNTSITVTGQGFPADTVVELSVKRPPESFTSEPLGQGQTDADGNVSFAAQVPALWLDGTPLEGPELTLELTTEDGDIRAVATVPFTAEELKSFLAVTPSSGAPGQEIQLQGIGFEPGQAFVVRVGPTATELVEDTLAEDSVGADGNFQETFTLPTTWPDTGADITEPSLVFAVVNADSGDIMATVSFSNDPAQAVPEGMDTPVP